MIAVFFSMILMCTSMEAYSTSISQFTESKDLFPHQLNVKHSPGKNKTTLLLSHGFGSNSQLILDRVRPYTEDTLISFNYIDHDFTHETGDDTKTVFATPLEIMPLIYMLKQCVIEKGISPISLYGYALGASNIVYALSFLVTHNQDKLLEKYNITESDKKAILDALRQGKILLDVPFKSIDEAIAFRGQTDILLMYKDRARTHNMLSPLETLGKLRDLKLNFLLFFDTNNEEFSNRDDSAFAKNLLEANSKGTNIVISSDSGGHVAPHKLLWKVYSCLQ